MTDTEHVDLTHLEFTPELTCEMQDGYSRQICAKPAGFFVRLRPPCTHLDEFYICYKCWARANALGDERVWSCKCLYFYEPMKYLLSVEPV